MATGVGGLSVAAPAGSAAAHVLHFEAARAEVTRKRHADIWLRVMPFTM